MYISFVNDKTSVHIISFVHTINSNGTLVYIFHFLHIISFYEYVCIDLYTLTFEPTDRL